MKLKSASLQNVMIELNNKKMSDLRKYLLFYMKSILHIVSLYKELIIGISKHCFINLPITILI